MPTLKHPEELNILAFDTSSEACSVALFHQNKILERHQVSEKPNSTHIIPMIQTLLNEVTISLKDLDIISFGAGPGSFTGLRVAASLAQGLTLGLSCDVIPVSTMRAMAQGAYRDHQERQVVVMLDARKSDVYYAVYHLNSCSVMQTQEEKIGPIDNFKSPTINDLFLVGSGAILHKDKLLHYSPSLRISHTKAEHPRARDIISLAQYEYSEGQAKKPHEALPIYLNDPY